MNIQKLEFHNWNELYNLYPEICDIIHIISIQRYDKDNSYTMYFTSDRDFNRWNHRGTKYDNPQIEFYLKRVIK
jgi:hypothetical protein